MSVIPAIILHSYKLSPYNVSNADLAGLEKDLLEITASGIQYLQDPCGHAVGAWDKIYQVAIGTIPPSGPNKCSRCDLTVVQLIPDRNIGLVVESLQRLIGTIKIQRALASTAKINVTRTITYAFQYQNAFLLSCGHAVSLGQIAKLAEDSSPAASRAVDLSDRNFRCSFCSTAAAFALPHHALRKLARIIAGLIPLTQLPQRKKPSPIPCNPPSTADDREKYCFKSLACLNPATATKDDIDNLFKNLYHLSPQSFLWEHAINMFAFICKHNTFDTALYFLLNFKGLEPRLLTQLREAIVVQGLHCVLEHQFGMALNIAQLLFRAEIPSPYLDRCILEAPLRCSNGMALHFASQLLLQFTPVQQYFFLQSFIDKLGRGSKGLSKELDVPETRRLIGSINSFKGFKLEPADATLIERFGSDRLLLVTDPNEGLRIWRWAAFLICSKNITLQRFGKALICEASIKNCVPPAGGGITQSMVSTLLQSGDEGSDDFMLAKNLLALEPSEETPAFANAAAKEGMKYDGSPF